MNFGIVFCTVQQKSSGGRITAPVLGVVKMVNCEVSLGLFFFKFDGRLTHSIVQAKVGAGLALGLRTE